MSKPKQTPVQAAVALLDSIADKSGDWQIPQETIGRLVIISLGVTAEMLGIESTNKDPEAVRQHLGELIPDELWLSIRPHLRHGMILTTLVSILEFQKCKESSK